MSTNKEREAIAEKLIKRGKFKEAIKEYQKLLTGGDQDVPIRNILGDLYVKADLKDRAIEEFQRIARHYEEKKIFAKSIALYKRITRLAPDDWATAEKLADLLRNQGFVSEAKTEYLRLAKEFTAKDKTGEAIRLYHKMLEIDKEDMNSRMALADLYEKNGRIEQAVEELNELAEIKMAGEKLVEAKQLLDRAREMQEDHGRTLSNLIDILKREKKDKEALKLVKNVLEKDKDNIKALKIYGNLLFGQEDYDKAERIFAKILSLRPSENNVRVRLGKIFILERKYDEAFALFEPIVESFLQKKMEDRAISLLGLILETKNIHLPTLEKLASIYKKKDQKENAGVVYKILLNTFRKKKQKEKMLDVLKDLVKVFPGDEHYYHEYKQLQKVLGVSPVDDEPSESLIQRERAEEAITVNLAKADLYIEQGLVRNAKRILDNLRINFPVEPRIEQKIEELKSIYPDYDRDEIPERVERVSEKETQLFGARGSLPSEESFIPGGQNLEDDTVSVAEIFADTDIIPFGSLDGRKDDFFDLAERIDEELEVMQDIVTLQKERAISSFEKPLSEIIADFKMDIGKKLPEANSEGRYNLGMAFMEQGLWDEALEEFKLASQDSSLAVDCYLVMSLCYREKKDFQEAMRWLGEALEIAGEDTAQAFSLKYELACLYEELNDYLKAMQIFIEVKKWKSDYRDVNTRLKELAKKIN